VKSPSSRSLRQPLSPRQHQGNFDGHFLADHDLVDVCVALDDGGLGYPDNESLLSNDFAKLRALEANM